MHLVARSLIAVCVVFSCGSAIAQIPVPEPAAIAITYHRDLFWIWVIEQVALFALPFYLLVSGRGSSIAAFGERLVRGRWILAAAVFAGTYALLYSIVQLPVGYVRSFWLNHYFNIDVPDVLPWMLDQIVPTAQLILIALAVGWIPLWLIRKSPNWWWAWSSGALAIIASTYFAVQPLWIDPLTKTYVQLADSDYANWQDRLERVLARAGANDAPVMVWETRESDFCRVQNSVVGLGPTRTIILADQIFTEWKPEQVDAALAHELKHYLFDNTWLPVLIIASLSVGGALAVLFLGRAVCRRWPDRLGFNSLDQPAALPLILVIVQLYMLIAIPIFNLTAQHVELEADRFALELTQDNEARALVSASQCGRLWLAEDTLFDRLYRNTHPSIADRVNLANSYRPWETGEPLVYRNILLKD